MGVIIQKFIPVSDKDDINLNLKIGPGNLYYRTKSTVTTSADVAKLKDVNEKSLSFFTGVGVDFHISNTLRFKLNVDKTLGRIF